MRSVNALRKDRLLALALLTRADYAVIGDVNEVVPVLNADLRKSVAGA